MPKTPNWEEHRDPRALAGLREAGFLQLKGKDQSTQKRKKGGKNKGPVSSCLLPNPTQEAVTRWNRAAAHTRGRTLAGEGSWAVPQAPAWKSLEMTDLEEGARWHGRPPYLRAPPPASLLPYKCAGRE